MRIVSLLPSATEIVCALGYQDHLVGRSHECDYPAGVESLPAVTRPRFDPEGSSREIDAKVKKLASEAAAVDALGVYEVLTAELERLRPTHIVTQTQCDVCAVSLRDVEAAVSGLNVDAQIVSSQPNSLEDVWLDFRRTAEALGDAEAGERLVRTSQRRLVEIERRAAGEPRVRVAGIEWLDPLMAFGNWTPTLLGLVGGDCVLGRAGEHSPWIEIDELVERRPDAVVVAPCGFGLERTRAELPALTSRPEWARLRGGAGSGAYVLDGNRLVNRPGPRLVDTVEAFAEILHPRVFGDKRRGVDWERIE